MSYVCDGVFHDAYSKLTKDCREKIFKLQGERTRAIVDWYDGRMLRDDARVIVARCNREIERLAAS